MSRPFTRCVCWMSPPRYLKKDDFNTRMRLYSMGRACALGLLFRQLLRRLHDGSHLECNGAIAT